MTSNPVPAVRVEAVRVHQERDFEVPAGVTWRFTVPPGVTHAYRNPGPGTLVIVAFNSELHDPEQPDTFRDEIL